jgi:hypothetical protein
MYIDTSLNEKGEFELSFHGLKLEHLHILSGALAGYKVSAKEKIGRLEKTLVDLTEPNHAQKQEMLRLQVNSLREIVFEITELVTCLEQVEVKPGIRYAKPN